MEYDWNTIIVGRPSLNSPSLKNFFGTRHALHEKGVKVKDVQIFGKDSSEEKVTIAPKRQKPTTTGKENISANNGRRAILAVSIVTKKPSSQAQQNSKTSVLRNVLKKSFSVPSTGLCEKSQPAQGKSTLKERHQAYGVRQYAQAEIIKKKREEFAKKIKEMEEKEMKFKFQAKSAPKQHKKNVVARPIEEKKNVTKQNSLPTMVMPRKTSNTSTALVPHCGDPEMLKLMKAKRDALGKAIEEPVQFKAKPAVVLTKRPFQPVHQAKAIVDQKPFKLQLTERLLQRSEFDKKLHEKIAQRKQNEEDLEKARDLEKRKLIRQKTEFKARPNPFGIH